MTRHLATCRCAAATAAAAVALWLAGCGPGGPPPDPADLSGDRALDNVRAFLALGRRDAGTKGADRAARWLRGRLTALGWTAEIDEFTEPSAGRPMTFRNVVARRSGRSRDIVVFGAHFDTKGGIEEFEGANDSGSGVGALLELARAGAAWAWPWEVRLAFFDGEECRVAYGLDDGLHGSRRLARRAVEEGWSARVRAAIVLDMVGDRDWTPTIPRNGTPALVAALLRAAGEMALRDRVRLAPGPILDDHQPFLDAGMPAVDLIDFEYGSAPGLNDFWHTPQDSLDKLAADSLERSLRLALRAALIATGQAR